MRIAFFGLGNSFDFERIGGTNSIVRRMALRLADLGDDVEYVHYGCDKRASRSINDRIEIHKCQTLADALSLLKRKYDHVVTIYLQPRDRLAYATFRKSQKAHMVFHHLYQGWSESCLKRQLLFAEARLFPFNGHLLCVSPRLYRYVSKWARNAILLLPSVPENYFLKPSEKPDTGKIRISYAGRVDPGKGTQDVVEIFRRLAGRQDIEARLCGFPWSHKPDTMRLHESLLSDSKIRYEPVEYEHWAPEVDGNLRALLRETDILLLPYRKLSSTIDTPLLLLEGMASLCAVITPPLGDMPKIYGPSPFSLSQNWDTNEVIDLIERSGQYLAIEKVRLARQNTSLGFDVSSITNVFRNALDVNN